MIAWSHFPVLLSLKIGEASPILYKFNNFWFYWPQSCNQKNQVVCFVKIVIIGMRVVYLRWRQSPTWSPMRYKIFQTYWYIEGLLISLGWIRDQWPVVSHNPEFHTPTGISRTTGTVQGYESWTFENNLPCLPQKKLILVVYNGGFWEVNDSHLIKFAWSESHYIPLWALISTVIRSSN